ncbi:MAG: hypothetical protein DME76_02145, partial [Verrucomicrobia bacterium]
LQESSEAGGARALPAHSCEQALTRGARFRVAHASRVLASASSRLRTFLKAILFLAVGIYRKDCFGATPKPARGTRALPQNRLLFGASTCFHSAG